MYSPLEAAVTQIKPLFVIRKCKSSVAVLTKDARNTDFHGKYPILKNSLLATPSPSSRAGTRVS